MSSLEMNKIAAAILTAGVVGMSSGFVAQLLTRPHEVQENAYVVTPAESAATTEMASEERGPESILPLLASADSAAGEQVYRKCTACHTIDQGGANKIGPNLWNIVDRDIAAVDGFSYSAALGDMEGTWTYDALNAFIANPKDFAPGTKMTYAGLKKIEDRANLIAFMRDKSDSPAPLPSAEEVAAIETAAEEAAPDETAAEESAPAEAPAEGEAAAEPTTGTQEAAANGSELAALMASADAADGEKVARKCKACHSFGKGEANKIGPNLYDIIDRPIAGLEGFNYSQALQDKNSLKWTYQHLEQYLERPKEWAPGNKMVFAGLRKPEDRAALLLYLRGLSDNPAPLPE